MLPSTRSPWWLLAFVLLALQLFGALVGLAMYRNGDVPPPETLASIAGVTAGIAAALSLIGWFGGRATFACATLGLFAGLAYMAWVYANVNDGMADLGALMTMLMLGALGLVLGIVLDIVRAVRSRR